MFTRFIPFFSPDDVGGSTPAAPESSDWGSFIRNEVAESLASADEGQPPAADPDAEGLEEADTNAEGQDVVEPNPDEADPNQENNPEAKPDLDDESDIDLGEGRQPVKLAELKQGYLRQSDYTKKTQALSDDRKALDAEKATVEPVRQWLDYINGNPWLFQQINSAIKEFQNTGALPIEEVLQDAQYGQYINHLLAENNRMKTELDSTNGKMSDMEFSSSMGSVITDLKAEYGELITPEYEQELRNQAKTEKLKPEVIKKMAKGDLAEKKLAQNKVDAKKISKETEAKTVQKLQEKRAALPPQPKSNGQRPGAEPKDIAGMSWLDIAKESMAK